MFSVECIYSSYVIIVDKLEKRLDTVEGWLDLHFFHQHKFDM